MSEMVQHTSIYTLFSRLLSLLSEMNFAIKRLIQLVFTSEVRNEIFIR